MQILNRIYRVVSNLAMFQHCYEKGMRGVHDELIPPWKGVVQTAEAECEAENSSGKLLWANIKFNKAWDGIDDVDVKDSLFFRKLLVKHSVSTGGKSLTLKEVARCKYHIDRGGE